MYLTGHLGQLSLAIPQPDGTMILPIVTAISMEEMVSLHNSRPCYHDCWHNNSQLKALVVKRAGYLTNTGYMLAKQ